MSIDHGEFEQPQMARWERMIAVVRGFLRRKGDLSGKGFDLSRLRCRSRFSLSRIPSPRCLKKGAKFGEARNDQVRA